MTSKRIEKEFDINIVASFVENKVLVVLDKNYTANKRKKVMDRFTDDLFEFCSFISGENINFSNISLYAYTIKNLLTEQYPNMKYRLINVDDSRLLTDKEIASVIMKYKEQYGDTIKIKSIKKEMVKSLKRTR